MSESPQEALEFELPDEPSIDLGAHQIKRQMLDSLFARAMSGLLPRSRALRSWEPDLLDERHLQALLLRSGGMPQGAIAQMMGWSESWTSVVLNHPDAQYVLTRLVSYAADNVIDLETRIKGYAPEALDTAVEIMRSSPDEKLRSQNAFELLRMAGYGTKRVESEKPAAGVHIGSMTINSVPEAAVNNLASAIREAREIEEVTYTLPAGLEVTVPRSDSSDSPASPAASGQMDAGEPPSSGSLDTDSRDQADDRLQKKARVA